VAGSAGAGHRDEERGLHPRLRVGGGGCAATTSTSS
jgi:hypothetical protein